MTWFVSGMKKVGLAAVFTAALMLAPIAQAQIQVSQETSAGAGDFDANILGTINPFTTVGSLSDFYGYNNPANGSFVGPVTLTSNTSHIFLVDSAVDGLGLFVVHDARFDGTGGTAFNRINLTGDANGFSVVVGDEPGEIVVDNANQISTHYIWDPCCTDGVALAALDGNSWAAFIQFLSSPTGLSSWLALSDGGGSVSLNLAAGVRTRLTLVPEPSTLGMLIIASGVLMTRRRRRSA